MSKSYKSGQIADKNLHLQEINTKKNSTQKDIVDVKKGEKYHLLQKRIILINLLNKLD
jgi:predicted  nucleic acid-binding Zn-ribbon protein